MPDPNQDTPLTLQEVASTPQTAPSPLVPSQVAPPLDPNTNPDVPLRAPSDVDTSAPDNLPEPKLSFGEQMAREADKLSFNAPTNPDGTPVPGTFSRMLVGAAMRTLGGASKIAEGVGASLGDAAIGKVPAGAGALYGINQTMANRNARLAAQKQQQKDNDMKDKEFALRSGVAQAQMDSAKAELAHTNAQTVFEQMQIHQLGEKAINDSVAQGKQAVAAMRSAHIQGTVAQEGLDSDQLAAMIKSGAVDPTRQTVFPTDRRPAGENEDGTQKYRTTYSVVNPPPRVKLTQDDADFLAKWRPNDPPIPAGSEMSGITLNTMWQDASNNQVATLSRNKTLADQKIATDEQNRKLEVVDLGPEWNNALATHGGNPVAARQALFSDPETVKKYPHLADDIVTAYGGQERWDKAIAEKQKAAIESLPKTPEETVAREVAARQAYAANSTPENKQALADATDMRQSFYSAQSAQKRADALAAEGDPNEAAKLLVNGTVAPNQLVSSRKPEFAQAAFTAAAKLKPGWSAQKADADFKIASSPNNTTFFGSANSLLDSGGTLDQLSARHDALGNSKLPVWNNAADLAAFQAGTPELAAFKQSVLGVADDYAKVMGGGVGSDSARNEIVKSLNYAYNNGQFDEALKAARQAIVSQKYARIGKNPVLAGMYATPGEQQQAAPKPQANQPNPSAINPRPANAAGTAPGSDGQMHYVTKAGVILGPVNR
jgi:hypothetical protein